MASLVLLRPASRPCSWLRPASRGMISPGSRHWAIAALLTSASLVPEASAQPFPPPPPPPPSLPLSQPSLPSPLSPPSPPSYPLAYYTITTTPGWWPSEVSWDLRCGGAVVLSSAPYTGSDECGLCPDFQTEYGVSLSPGVECELVMYDSWGDGWNEATWSGLGQEGLTVASGPRRRSLLLCRLRRPPRRRLRPRTRSHTTPSPRRRDRTLAGTSSG